MDAWKSALKNSACKNAAEKAAYRSAMQIMANKAKGKSDEKTDSR